MPATNNDQLPPRAPRPDEELTHELRTIYDENGPETDDLRRLVRVRRSLGKKLLIGSVLFFAFLAAVSWAGFFLFSPTDRRFSGDGVELRIDGPARVKSGDLVSYRVSWRNGERVPLGTADLELRLPTEFAVARTTPTSERPTWQIGSIAAGKEGSVLIEGVFVAPVAKQLDFQAILTYRPADFNSSFQKVATQPIAVGDSVIDLQATGPDKVLPGDKTTFDFSYVNTSPQEFTNAQFRLRYPSSGFIPESAEPAADDAGFLVWTIGNVTANSANHIRLTGTFAAEAQGKLTLIGQIGFTDQAGEFQLQKETPLEVEVVSGQLLTTLILNGKSGDQPVRAGDTLHYAVSWHNTGQSDLEDVTFSAVIETAPAEGNLIGWNDLHDDQSGTRDGSRITWTRKQVEALKRIGPGQEGTIDFSLPLVAELPSSPDGSYRVTAWVETRVQSVDGEPTDRLTQTTPFAATVLSDATVTTEARYFSADGLPVGSGPLPPQVGETTSYRVYWTLTNSLHELGDLKLSARLPENATFAGRSGTDAGDVRFDAAENKVVWSLNWLPTTVNKLTVWFDVALVPSDDQIGKTPTLIDATIFEAKDRQANFGIILSAPPLSTELPDDAQASGRGRVIR